MTVSRLARLDLKARLVVEGFIAGLHSSPYHGFSVEYAEHRQYMPGDPIKHIDWKVFAKSDRFYIKEYEEETNLKSYIFLDVSASMEFVSTGISKLEYGRYLAAALTYLMLSQQDSVGLVLYDERIRQYVPPRSVRNHLHIILQRLHAAAAGAGTRSLRGGQQRHIRSGDRRSGALDDGPGHGPDRRADGRPDHRRRAVSQGGRDGRGLRPAQ